MGNYFYRFEKKTGYCKIFKWDNGKAIFVRSLGTAEKLHNKMVSYEK